jgi:hydroxyacylglutathione hydrolase
MSNLSPLLETMQFVFEQVRVGGDRNFAYLVGDRSSKTAVVVDPAYSPEQLIERAREQSLVITHILNTHGHPDHTNGNARAKEMTEAPIVAYRSAVPAPDIALDDHSTLKVGGLTLLFIHTPGHAQDHLVIYIQEQDVALTGDLIFVGKVGGTATDEDARTEWSSLQKILSEIPGTATVWPGHDYGSRPASTIKLEKQSNPFLCCPDLDAFLQLKNGWAEFKSTHGLQ